MIPTPLIKLDNLFLKREDLNETGSAKDRAISVQVNSLKEQGIKEAVISSTGNAAISALYFCNQNGIKLTVFVSPKIDKHKLELLKKENCNIRFSPKAISDAFKYSKSQNAFFLRQSTDPNALIGYQNIGKELLNELPQASSVFIPMGSGTTLLGVSQSLPNVKIFGIQPAAHCPIAKIFDTNFVEETENITDAISVNLLPLKTQIISAIKNSDGSAFVVQNQDILKANDFLESNNINTSLEGALALAGYFKAIKQNIDVGQNPVIILTGAQR